MDAFSFQIAGLVFCAKPMFLSTKEYFRPYLVEEQAAFYMEVTERDLQYEQHMLEIEAVEEGIRIRKFTGPFLERAAIQRKVAQALLLQDTILFHGSTVGVDGHAYLFTAPCGTGKSTHTRFWREVFGPRAVMVNDDKAFLKITPDGVLAYGSPWSGKHGLHTNICLPLKGLCFLRRGADNRIQEAKCDDWMGELRHQCFVPEDPSAKDRAFSLIDALAQIVPLWEMDCTKDSAAVLVAYEAMSGK